MQTLSGVKLQVDPDTRICATEQITGELSKCSGNNEECKYRFYEVAADIETGV